jgi:hypothetical protein
MHNKIATLDTWDETNVMCSTYVSSVVHVLYKFFFLTMKEK